MLHLLRILALSVPLALAGQGASAAAQVRTVDPNGAIDRDLAAGSAGRTDQQPRSQEPAGTAGTEYGEPVPSELPGTPPPSSQNAPAQAANSAAPGAAAATYQRKDVFTAAESVFGKGAEGLGGILERILKDQGEPNAYITGREASGAFVVGLRYGSGVLSHKIEGDQPVYWTGPSIGFDAGGNASKVFVLVYNLYDSHDIFRRFPEGEGHLYLVGGFSATYLRRGDIVLIPVRLGVGVRAGLNVGYMKFTAKSKWVPF